MLGRLSRADPPPALVAAGRARLLQEVRAGGGGLAASQRPRVGSLAAAAGLLLLVAAGGAYRGARGGLAVSNQVDPASDSGAGALEVRVTETPGSVWSRARDTRGETVVLREGELSLDVRRRGSSPRLVVEVPDGVIEDVGTVFRVRVVSGHTVAVSVTSGRVLMRLGREAERTLSAGESWARPAEAVSAADSSGGMGAGTAGSSSAPRSDAARHLTDVGPAPSGCKDTGEFQLGVKAFGEGRYPASIRALESYERRCGTSEHAEDAAYLRMIALARAGRAADAAGAAQRYVTRFPHGFRRKEAERLLGETP